MAGFSDDDLRQMMGTLSILVADSKREIGQLHEKLEHNGETKYQSLETYINSKYTTTIKSFEKLKYLDIDDPELVNSWIICFNQVKRLHPQVFDAFMNAKSEDEIGIEKLQYTPYTGKQLNDMMRIFYMRISELIERKVDPNVSREIDNGETKFAPNLFKKVYEMIISKPDVSAAERIGHALFKLQSKLRELERDSTYLLCQHLQTQEHQHDDLIYKFLIGGVSPWYLHLQIYLLSYKLGTSNLFLEVYARHYELYKADPNYKLPDIMTLLNEIRSNRDYSKVVNAAKKGSTSQECFREEQQKVTPSLLDQLVD